MQGILTQARSDADPAQFVAMSLAHMPSALCIPQSTKHRLVPRHTRMNGSDALFDGAAIIYAEPKLRLSRRITRGHKGW